MSHRRRLFLISLLSLTVGAFLPAAAQDNGSRVRIVRISYVQGTVQFNGTPAVMNSPVTEDSRLVTGTDGLAEVEFEDESAIRLASETEINFAQLARLSTGEAMTRVDLEDGEAEFLIPASSAGRFAVNVKGKNILFKKPGRFRILSTHASPLEIAVWKGEVGVRDLESGQEVTVKDRETFAVNPDDLGQYDLENSVLADDLDRWSEQRDQDLRSNYVASNNTYNNSVYDQYYQSGGYPNTYPSPYLYGYGFYGYNAFGCPFGFGQPFWFGSPGCWNSGFFFNPFFFSPPVVVVVTPPIRPRRPVPIRPPTVPAVAKNGLGGVAAKPGFHNFRDQGASQRVFNDENFARTGIKPGESTPQPAQSNVTEAVRTPSTMPGQHSTGASGAPPVHVAPPNHAAPLPSRPAHSSPPPPRPPSHSFSAPRGPSGGSFSHASSPASHSAGRR